MKIKLESAELEETEVIIRGDVTSNEVVSILQLLRKQNTGKLILYRAVPPELESTKNRLPLATAMITAPTIAEK